jgi:hypothetical protein
MPTITVKLDTRRAARLNRWARRHKVAKSDVIRTLIDRTEEHGPVRQRTFVAADAVLAAFASAPPIDRRRFRDDVDALIDQDAAPRG